MRKSSPIVYTDGFLYIVIAVIGSLIASMCTDEAAKYVAPALLFWIRISLAAASAGFLGLKTYRSTAYSDERNRRDRLAALGEIPPRRTEPPAIPAPDPTPVPVQP